MGSPGTLYHNSPAGGRLGLASGNEGHSKDLDRPRGSPRAPCVARSPGLRAPHMLSFLLQKMWQTLPEASPRCEAWHTEGPQSLFGSLGTKMPLWEAPGQSGRCRPGRQPPRDRVDSPPGTKSFWLLGYHCRGEGVRQGRVHAEESPEGQEAAGLSHTPS